MREPPAGERVAQRARHRVLPDDIVEALRPPLACEKLEKWIRVKCGVHRTAARCTCVHLRVYLALLPSGPDAVRRLKLHRVRAAMRLAGACPFTRRSLGRSRETSVYQC